MPLNRENLSQIVVISSPFQVHLALSSVIVKFHRGSQTVPPLWLDLLLNFWRGCQLRLEKPKFKTNLVPPFCQPQWHPIWGNQALSRTAPPTHLRTHQTSRPRMISPKPTNLVQPTTTNPQPTLPTNPNHASNP